MQGNPQYIPANPQYTQVNQNSYNPNFQQYQQYPPQVSFLPQPSQAFKHQVDVRPNHDSYAANEPNPMYHNINQGHNLYPQLQPAKEAPFKTP